MEPTINHYFSYTAPRLRADPVFMEWVFFPHARNEQLWLDLLANLSKFSFQISIAREWLLRYSSGQDCCPLIRKAVNHYAQMKKDIYLMQSKELQPSREIENCFAIANNYWAILRNECLHHEFELPWQEIHFFKVIKPLFTHEVEYYGLRSYAQLFFDATFGNQHEEFRNSESCRKEKFESENRVFVDYYRGGATEMDREWFTRIYGEEKDRSHYDERVASLLALERYHNFISFKRV